LPIISIFFGIVIRLYHKDHNPPHFHAIYGEYEIIVEIKSGKVLAGRFPNKALSLVEEWRTLHIPELTRTWEQASAMKTPKKIKGLE